MTIGTGGGGKESGMSFGRGKKEGDESCVAAMSYKDKREASTCQDPAVPREMEWGPNLRQAATDFCISTSKSWPFTCNSPNTQSCCLKDAQPKTIQLPWPKSPKRRDGNLPSTPAPTAATSPHHPKISQSKHPTPQKKKSTSHGSTMPRTLESPKGKRPSK